MPPVAYFGVSAVFHYLGPSFAVLLFAHLDVLGVGWLRIASAAVVFAVWRRPWRVRSGDRRTLAQLGVVLAAMNLLFYVACDRLPLATVGAIEFLGTIVLAAVGVRSPRNLVALALAVAGVAALTDVHLVAEPLGFACAVGNCVLFMLYVVLGHRVANTGNGLDRLAVAMLVAAVVATPIGLSGALAAFTHPTWLAWGIAVGVCSSVIPYVTDQLAMARLPRATFALMLALLPAIATVIGAIVLSQVPTAVELLGIGLISVGVATHREGEAAQASPSR